MTVAYPSGPEQPPHAIHVLRSPTLPYVALDWITEASLVAGGHDCQPVLFEGDVNAGWHITKTLDVGGSAATKAAPPPPPPKAPGLSGGGGAPGVGRLNNDAFNRFKSADARGSPTTPSSATFGGGAAGASGGAGNGSIAGHLGAVAGASVGADGELHTTHQNTITSIRTFEGSREDVKSISTSGVDGRLCVFEVKGKGAGVGGIQKGLASIRIA